MPPRIDRIAWHAEIHTLRQRRMALLAWAMTALFVSIALTAMGFAPRVPYADSWRFLGHFASTAFPANILTPDNGHHEVFPNAVRVAELHWFGANQWLQIGIGVTLLLSALAVAWRMLRQEQPPALRAAAMLIVAAGLCWLGNVRTLMHANESVHAYAVVMCLIAGLWCLAKGGDEPPGVLPALMAGVLGLVAAFCFGSGIACFAAFLIVAQLLQARLPAMAVLAAMLMVTLMFLLISSAPKAAMPVLQPIGQAELWLRWLSGPWLYAVWPALDPAIAAQLSIAPLRHGVQSIAQLSQTTLGPATMSRWPHLGIGIAGIAALAFCTWRAQGDRRPSIALGLGLAWFGCAVGALIAIVRFHYFQAEPAQLLAPRYIVWSSLFWCGLGLLALAQARIPLTAALTACLAVCVLLPSQAWMAKLGWHMRQVADRTALAAAVGVLPRGLETGESVPAELAQALPAIRAAHASVFAWPQMRWLGQRPPISAVEPVAIQALRVRSVDNQLGASGRQVHFRSDAKAKRLLLLDADGVARGIAAPDAQAQGAWLGWMQGGRESHMPHAVKLR